MKPLPPIVLVAALIAFSAALYIALLIYAAGLWDGQQP